MTTCDECGQTHPGLTWVIDDAAFRAIKGSLNGFLCLWCADKKLGEAGIKARVQINLCLPNLDGSNPETWKRFEEIDAARAREAMIVTHKDN